MSKKLGIRLNKKKNSNQNIMGLFRRETVITETVCKICGMEFASPDRTMRHMVKAHSKACKTSGSGCGCS